MLKWEVDPVDLVVDDEAIERDLKRFGLVAQQTIRLGMRNTPKTGRRYKRKGGKTHIASKVGNYPAIDSRRLAGSIDFEAEPRSVEIGTGVEYSVYVHPLRPFLVLGFNDTLRAYPTFLSDYITRKKP